MLIVEQQGGSVPTIRWRGQTTLLIPTLLTKSLIVTGFNERVRAG
jgi:hypothetical protein